jgi:hypothetical protein
MSFRSIRRTLARSAAAACVALTLPASATVHSTDFTDMWWNSAEDGWGVNVIQQGDTLFATFFVYGSDQSPRWYVASNLAPQTATAGTHAFSGKLYSTTGPWFGGAFNPANVVVTEVGTATFTFTSPGTLALNYLVNGVAVSKNLTRLTWRTDSPSGRFVGGLAYTASPCSNSSNQGSAAIPGIITTAFNGTQVQFRIDSVTTNGVCLLTGNWIQQGRLASVTGGTWTCQVGNTVTNQGTFTLSVVDVQVTGFSGTWTASDQFCQYNGRLGGVRDVVN